MKIQLDTTNKIIKLEDRVELSELVRVLESLLPKGEWKKFTLEMGVIERYCPSVMVDPDVTPSPKSPWYKVTTPDGIALLRSGLRDFAVTNYY